MGDRVSISFVKGDEESVSLFSHWGGLSFVGVAQGYADSLCDAKKGKETMPLDRLEPNTVMVDFIRYLTKNKEKVESDLYLGADGNSGDNSDNGHHKIYLKKRKS